MKNMIQFVIVVMAGMVAFVGQAQKKATVEIIKRDNGKTEIIIQEIEIDAGKDVDEILKEMGLLDDLNQLGEGQTLEINIRQIESADTNQGYDIRFYDMEQERAYLGVTLESVFDDHGETRGARIVSIVEGTAAEQAELREDDEIISINGTMNPGVNTIVQSVREMRPGDVAEIEIIRGGQVLGKSVVLGEKQREDSYVFPFGEGGDEWQSFEWNDEFEPWDQFEFEGAETKSQAFFGVSPSWNQDHQGVKIGEVTPGSSAEEMGVLAGDIILEFNDQEVHSFDELADLIGKTYQGDDIKIKLKRDGKNRTLKGEMGSRAYQSYGNMSIFPDFKGMDEDGNMMYDFHLDMGEDEWPFGEEQLEQLFESLSDNFAFPNMENLLGIPELSEIPEIPGIRDLGELGLDELWSTSIYIDFQNLSSEEAAQVNKGVQKAPLLEAKQDLEMNRISFFPNPNSGIFNLNFELRSSDRAGIFIYNQTGAVIYEEWINDGSSPYTNQIDLSDQSVGTYYLQIIQGGESYSKKIIRN